MKIKAIMTFLALSFVLVSFRCYAEEMTVSAAASLTDVFNELIGDFEKQHPGLKVNANYAASTPLLRQIMAGAPVDVFATADQQTMDKASKEGLIHIDSRKNFAGNTLALIMPKGSKKAARLQDLTDLKRIAIGDPDSVPAGRYAREALTNAGMWDKLHPAFILCTNVRQALGYVATGEADAGFVYGTDAASMGDKIEKAFTITGHKPIIYPMAVAKTGANEKMARAFTDFTLSTEGRAILAKYGFSLP